MEEKKTARQWCDEAVSYVRFRPDRSAIRRELTQHLMDSRFQLLDQGLDTETADARSVADMGDPQTVGLALDRAHNPFLGWLWELSRLVCPVLRAAVRLAVHCAKQPGPTYRTGLRQSGAGTGPGLWRGRRHLSSFG